MPEITLFSKEDTEFDSKFLGAENMDLHQTEEYTELATLWLSPDTFYSNCFSFSFKNTKEI